MAPEKQDTLIKLMVLTMAAILCEFLYAGSQTVILSNKFFYFWIDVKNADQFTLDLNIAIKQ